jgi:hypothetical protein
MSDSVKIDWMDATGRSGTEIIPRESEGRMSDEKDTRYIGIPLHPWMQKWIDDCRKAESDNQRLREALEEIARLIRGKDGEG